MLGIPGYTVLSTGVGSPADTQKPEIGTSRDVTGLRLVFTLAGRCAPVGGWVVSSQSDRRQSCIWLTFRFYIDVAFVDGLFFLKTSNQN